MKIYKNEFTKKILIGLTSITLLASSYGEAKAINNYKIPENNYSYQTTMDVNYTYFNNFYNNVKRDIIILKNIDIPFSHIDPSQYSSYSPNYDVGLKILLYFANYDYIKNTAVEDTLIAEKIIDTYSSVESFGLTLDLNAADSILLDYLTYNHQNFSDITYDEDEFIINREFNLENLTQLINPSIFLMNDKDRIIVDRQFNILVELIKHCYNDNQEGINRCLYQYFNLQNFDISNSARWLNNVTNNAMCIKILETYMLQKYNKSELETIFGSFESANLYFELGEPEECCEEYSTENVNFDNIQEPFFRLLLECDKKLHTAYYCNTNNHLLESIDLSLQKEKTK